MYCELEIGNVVVPNIRTMFFPTPEISYQFDTAGTYELSARCRNRLYRNVTLEPYFITVQKQIEFQSEQFVQDNQQFCTENEVTLQYVCQFELTNSLDQFELKNTVVGSDKICSWQLLDLETLNPIMEKRKQEIVIDPENTDSVILTLSDTSFGHSIKTGDYKLDLECKNQVSTATLSPAPIIHLDYAVDGVEISYKNPKTLVRYQKNCKNYRNLQESHNLQKIECVSSKFHIFQAVNDTIDVTLMIKKGTNIHCQAALNSTLPNFLMENQECLWDHTCSINQVNDCTNDDHFEIQFDSKIRKTGEYSLVIEAENVLNTRKLSIEYELFEFPKFEQTNFDCKLHYRTVSNFTCQLFLENSQQVNSMLGEFTLIFPDLTSEVKLLDISQNQVIFNQELIMPGIYQFKDIQILNPIGSTFIKNFNVTLGEPVKNFKCEIDVTCDIFVKQSNRCVKNIAPGVVTDSLNLNLTLTAGTWVDFKILAYSMILDQKGDLIKTPEKISKIVYDQPIFYDLDRYQNQPMYFTETLELNTTKNVKYFPQNYYQIVAQYKTKWNHDEKTVNCLPSSGFNQILPSKSLNYNLRNFDNITLSYQNSLEFIEIDRTKYNRLNSGDRSVKEIVVFNENLKSDVLLVPTDFEINFETNNFQTVTFDDGNTTINLVESLNVELEYKLLPMENFNPITFKGIDLATHQFFNQLNMLKQDVFNLKYDNAILKNKQNNDNFPKTGYFQLEITGQDVLMESSNTAVSNAQGKPVVDTFDYWVVDELPKSESITQLISISNQEYLPLSPEEEQEISITDKVNIKLSYKNTENTNKNYQGSEVEFCILSESMESIDNPGGLRPEWSIWIDNILMESYLQNFDNKTYCSSVLNLWSINNEIEFKSQIFPYPAKFNTTITIRNPLRGVGGN